MNSQPTTPKKNNRPMLIGAAVGVVLVLLCAVLTSGVIGNLLRGDSAEEPDVVMGEPDDITTTDNQAEVLTADTGSTLEDSDFKDSRADATLLSDVWRDLEAAFERDGCPLEIDDVEVVRGPDDAGVWIEDWEVENCNGSSVLTITFTPAAAGGTTFEVRGNAPGQ